jgi:hypothetical protein
LTRENGASFTGVPGEPGIGERVGDAGSGHVTEDEADA